MIDNKPVDYFTAVCIACRPREIVRIENAPIKGSRALGGLAAINTAITRIYQTSIVYLKELLM